VSGSASGRSPRLTELYQQGGARLWYTSLGGAVRVRLAAREIDVQSLGERAIVGRALATGEEYRLSQ
jgi:hypothetical protein